MYVQVSYFLDFLSVFNLYLVSVSFLSDAGAICTSFLLAVYFSTLTARGWESKGPPRGDKGDDDGGVEEGELGPCRSSAPPERPCVCCVRSAGSKQHGRSSASPKRQSNTFRISNRGVLY